MCPSILYFLSLRIASSYIVMSGAHSIFEKKRMIGDHPAILVYQNYLYCES